MPSEDVFAWLQRARAKGDIAVVLRTPLNGKLLSGTPAPDYVSQKGRHILLLYKQRSAPGETP